MGKRLINTTAASKRHDGLGVKANEARLGPFPRQLSQYPRISRTYPLNASGHPLQGIEGGHTAIVPPSRHLAQAKAAAKTAPKPASTLRHLQDRCSASYLGGGIFALSSHGLSNLAYGNLPEAFQFAPASVRTPYQNTLSQKQYHP